MRKLQDSASLVQKTRGNPFKSAIRSEVPLPAPKKPCLPIQISAPAHTEIEIYPLPTYYPEDFACVNYWHAWRAVEQVCCEYPLVVRPEPHDPKILLVQMQDTLATTQRALTWAGKFWHTSRVFVHDDEPVSAFLNLLQTARSFDATAEGSNDAVAVFLYPTTFVLEDLARQPPLQRHVKIMVLLDDVYCPAAKCMRAGSTLLFADPIPKDAVMKCLQYLQKVWRISSVSARKDFWLARAGSDPRLLLHMLYFERLLYATTGVSWGFQINFDAFSWVHLWFWHGFQNLQELHYHVAQPAVLKNQLGVIAHQVRGGGAVSVIAWDYSVKKLPVPDQKTNITSEDIDIGLALAYLHWAVPLAVNRMVYRVLDDKKTSFLDNQYLGAEAIAETWDVLSLADVQQNHFQPAIMPLHQGALRLGIYRVFRYEHHVAFDENWRDAPKKSFYDSLERQKGAKARANQALQVQEFAPLVFVHRSETLARLLFLADPQAKNAYWPSKMKAARAYADEANMQHTTPFEDVCWRLIWRFVEDFATKRGVIPTRPTSTFSEKPAKPILSPCGHQSAFAWCFQCGTPPSEPVFRCVSGCQGWGSCLACAAYNKVLADVVSRARALV